MNWNLNNLPSLMNESFTVYPNRNKVLFPFELKPNDVKIVIIGNEPYSTMINRSRYGNLIHNRAVSDGRAFSVSEDIEAPPRLVEIHEYLIESRLRANVRDQLHNLGWSEQGVLCLNAALTCLPNQPHSHLEEWKPFLEEVLSILNVPILRWGNNAQQIKVKNSIDLDQLDLSQFKLIKW